MNFSHTNQIYLFLHHELIWKSNGHQNPTKLPVLIGDLDSLTHHFKRLLDRFTRFRLQRHKFPILTMGHSTYPKNCPFPCSDQHAHQHCTFLDPTDPLPQT